LNTIEKKWKFLKKLPLSLQHGSLFFLYLLMNAEDQDAILSFTTVVNAVP